MDSSTLPLVSVVIPCYNQGRFLRDAVDSVLRQTHAHVEAIVVDDGSTDDTAAVMRTLPAARCLSQRNQGAPAARNMGLRASRGDYVIFLDADDRLLPEAIATGLEALAAHPEWAFVTGHVRLVESPGSPAVVPPQGHVDPDPFLDLLRSNYIWTPGVVMYRRVVFDSVAPFDSSAGGAADYELNIRIARRFPIGCHHRIILEYRRHGANMSADVRYMLQSAVSVRRAAQAELRANRAATEAIRAGIATVQADFGRRLIDQVKSDLLTGRVGRAASGVLCLLRYYPAGIGRLIGDGVSRAFGRSR